MTTVPIARGLILCKSSHEDDFAGLVTLADCFDVLTVRGFPSPGRTFWAAAFLSDGDGDLHARLEVVHLDRDRVVYVHEHRVGLRGRLAVYNYRHYVSGCVFPEPGVYEAVLYVAGEVVAATAFAVRMEEADDE